MYKSKFFEKVFYCSEFIKFILNILREKNFWEKDYFIRVVIICIEIGKFLGMKKYDLNLFEVIVLFYDIGKIVIDEVILNKLGKLIFKEWEVIKKYFEIGYRIIFIVFEYVEIVEDILFYYEYFNG